MTWITPWIAGIAAAIAVPTLIILYFLKLRRRDLEVSTTLLWKKAIQDLQANAPFQKLRRNILLILQLIVLAAAIAAVGQPQLKGLSTVGQRHIILIDRSASMKATDGDPTVLASEPTTRLAAAKKQAVALIESLREPGLMAKDTADQAMIIAFDSTAEVRQNFTTDKAALKAAIEAIEPTDGPTLLSEAMRLAKAHAPRRQFVDTSSGATYSPEGLEGGEPATLHLWSDGCIPDADESKPGPDDTFNFHRVGRPDAANIGITGLRSERAYDQPSKLSIFVGVQSTFRAPRRVDVEMSIDGSVAGIKNITIPPATIQAGADSENQAPAGASKAEPAADDAKPAPNRPTPGSTGVVFALDRAEGGLIQIRIRGLEEPVAGALPADIDNLDIDNRAWLVVPPAKRLAVAIVTRGNLFISTALGGLPLSKRDTFTPDEFQKLLSDGKAGEYDVVVLDGWLPPAPASGGLPPGRYVVLGEVPTGAGLIDKGRGPAAFFVDWARQHPVVRSLNLDDLTIAVSRLVEVAPRKEASPADPAAGKPPAPESVATAVVIATTSQGPGILEAGGADWRAVVVPFDAAESDWPFHVSFVVFMASAVDYIGGGHGASGIDQLVRPGSILATRLPAGTTEAEVLSPDGTTAPLTVASDGRVVFGPLRTIGVYETSWKGPAGPADRQAGSKAIRPFAADLLDPAESDVGSTEQLALANRTVTATDSAESKVSRKLWPWLVLAALAVVMLEWFVYNRKVHV